MPDWVDNIVGNDIQDFVVHLGLVLGVLILTWIAQRVVRWVVLILIKAILRATTPLHHLGENVDDLVGGALVGPVRLLIITIGVRLGLLLGQWFEDRATLIDQTTITLISIAVFWGILRLANLTTVYYVNQSAAGKLRLDETGVRFGRQLVIALILIFGLSTVLEQWGVNIGTLVAGLGVISLAVALAAQDLLGNVIAYFAILADSPFRVGNVIALDDKLMGTVEEISFRSTRLRTRDHALVIIPNRTVANANVTNWTRINRRRYETDFMVPAALPPEHLRALLGEIRALLDPLSQSVGGRTTLQIDGLGEDKLKISIAASLRVSDWDTYQDARFGLDFKIMEMVKKYTG
jgi:MscS family membrane protein